MYIDDLLIATETEENLQILNEVYKLLTDNLLNLRIEKLCFLKRKIDYLGYTASEERISPLLFLCLLNHCVN